MPFLACPPPWTYVGSIHLCHRTSHAPQRWAFALFNLIHHAHLHGALSVAIARCILERKTVSAEWWRFKVPRSWTSCPGRSLSSPSRWQCHLNLARALRLRSLLRCEGVIVHVQEENQDNDSDVESHALPAPRFYGSETPEQGEYYLARVAEHVCQRSAALWSPGSRCRQWRRPLLWPAGLLALCPLRFANRAGGRWDPKPLYNYIYIYIHSIYHLLFIFHGLSTYPNSTDFPSEEPQAARLDLTAVSYASALTACERVSLWEKALELGKYPKNGGSFMDFTSKNGHVHGFLWEKMWIFMGKKCGCSLILMGKCRFSWIFMGQNVDVHGFHWKYVDFHWFSWEYVDFHGF